jgi:hypothetical protein
MSPSEMPERISKLAIETLRFAKNRNRLPSGEPGRA